MYKVWIGNRESEILTCNYFNESLTFFGNNTNGNSSFVTTNRVPSNYNKEFKDFIIKNIERIIDAKKESEFHFYNQKFAYLLLENRPDFRKHFVNINDYEIIKWINSKTFIREWLNSSVNVPPFALLSKKECNIKRFTSLFGTYDEFILQKDVSGGGEGTYILNNKNINEVLCQIDSRKLYLVSPYLAPKTNICCHMLIANDKIIIFPYGLQKSERINNRLIYKGTCYYQNNFLDNKYIAELNRVANIVGENLKNIGYRGICGLDFILSSEKIYFIEVNARYLGSTFLINKALVEQSRKTVFEMNSMCFNGSINEKILDGFTINYSSNNEKSISQLNKEEVTKLLKEKKASKKSIIFQDGLTSATFVAENTYLFREIFASDIIQDLTLLK